MPRIVGSGSSKLRLCAIALVVLFFFTPISKAFLNSVGGSFAPSPFTSLAVRTPSDPSSSFEVGDLVPLRLTNRTGSTKTYQWSATQRGVVISLGEKTVLNGHGVNVNVPTSLAKTGTLRVAIANSRIFVTVFLQRSAQ
jgi:hypothetical protein